MANYYNIDGIITELQKRACEARAILEAWENVTFPTKKDGTPYKAMARNICGASYFIPNHALQDGEYILRVCTWCKASGYISSEIGAHCLVKYIKDDTKKAKTDNYKPKQPGLEQVYTFDLDDIKEAVAKRIAALKLEIEQLEAAQANAHKAFTTFREAYASALAKLENDTCKDENCTLYYMIKDTVQARFPYC